MVGQRRWAVLAAILLPAWGCGGGPPLHDAASFVRHARSARIIVQPKGDDAKPRRVEVKAG